MANKTIKLNVSIEELSSKQCSIAILSYSQVNVLKIVDHVGNDSSRIPWVGNWYGIENVSEDERPSG